ncbi:succinate dehydrogenase cytochrome b560 subunit, mitochondrial-like [Homarus americanus]|uniref:succinate dehydrogenase cytochrome b560 subunit, mitochondrial-like n=1 Tax=Homarus americanus TaxID=6706 RepID=UPI001C482E04|nr:succinate dehydrogenase cytochrome b560 subunit, mitochondrial-like [Homarus americanus]
MALVLRFATRGCGGASRHPTSLQGPQWSRALFTTPTITAMNNQTAEDYWAKNKRLRRPVSPHMTIYKPQITSMLSLSHRASGLALSGLMSGFSIGMLALPGSYPHYLSLVQSMEFGGVLICGVKFLLAMPFMYHLCNGVRHLVWDLGYGFTLRTLYQTGYFVIGLSLVLSGVVAVM